MGVRSLLQGTVMKKYRNTKHKIICAFSNQNIRHLKENIKYH